MTTMPRFAPMGINVSGGSARVQGTSASLYAAWFGQNWNFNGIASLGRLVTNLTRQVSYTVSYQTPSSTIRTRAALFLSARMVAVVAAELLCDG